MAPRGPIPQFQVETRLLPGTCQQLPALLEHPGPGPRTVAKKGSTALSDALLAPVPALRSAWRIYLPTSFPAPPWGQRLAPFWLSPGPPDSQKVLCFWSSVLPPPSLSAQRPWRRWGNALCGSLSGTHGGHLHVSHFVYTAGWKVDTRIPFCR